VDFTSTTGNIIVGNVFEGAYSIPILPTGYVDGSPFYYALINQGINPSGITGTFVYFQSGNEFIDSGYLLSGLIGQSQVLSGATSSPSNASGYLFYRINASIYGTCCGVGSDANVWFSGYSFYNAFHPGGYYSPPFGENLSVYKQNQDGTSSLSEVGSCDSLTTTEYNDIFGINTQLDDLINDSSDSATAYINSPAIACPQDLSVTYYWHETDYNIIAGTSSAIAGNTFYNTNPIPTSLDNFYVKTNLRYATSGSGLGILVDNGDGTKTEEILETILYDSSGRPIPAYPTFDGGVSGHANSDIFNTQTCPGYIAENGIAIGQNTESQLIDVADASQGSDGHFDFFNWWNIWHFLPKENSDGFPFSNGYSNSGNVGLTTDTDGNQGSSLFEYSLADSDAYWDRRQCPEAISFLPHTFGASIFACPQYYLDVPYYAANKKFGFYGTRFLNGCVSLEMDYPTGTTPNVSDLPTGYTYITPQEIEPSPDAGINWSFPNYTNLLRIAAAEEKQSDFYALNKSFFLWTNSGLVTQSSDFAVLTGNSGFYPLFLSLFGQYNNYFPSGTGDFVNKNSGLFESGVGSIFYDTGTTYEFLGNNDNYILFKNQLTSILTGINEINSWASIESQYACGVLDSNGNIASDFYGALNSGKQSRLQTRYFENYVKGNPIDLYPTNKITFSYDHAGDFINSSGWGKSPFGFGLNSSFADSGLTRRYFVGAYGDGEDISELTNFISQTANINNGAFYPGYFDNNQNMELPEPTYTPVLTGSGSMNGGTFNPLPNGWMAMGYNGVGEMKNNFSCFTPIFIRQPFNKTYCKVGQSPTFRSLAVDYHTIPEDKINIRYPEIVYWAEKLKMIDTNYNNLYPLSYKWYRIPTGSCTGSNGQASFSNFLLNPNFELLDPSNPTGDWCALEGDGPICTLIHPTGCVPAFTPNGAWAYPNIDTPIYKTAQQNNFYMTKKKGAIKGVDDQYYYFCMTRGRFGIRISEPSELFIEDWLKFDLSIQNGGNVTINPTVQFVAGDTGISCSPTNVVSYGGFVRDNDSIPEDVIQEQIPPPNAGYGDVFSYKFVGSWAYRGANQTYVPGTLKDTRGLQETWGRLLDYGTLVQYNVTLAQEDGDFLYGRNHLPVCSNNTMVTAQDGIKVIVDGVVHWANMQSPIVDTDGRYGVLWNQLGNAGELYVPSDMTSNGGIASWSPGVGQWQYGNNLGTIHSFGWDSQLADITKIGNGGFDNTSLQTLKKNLLGGGALGGENCGWNKYGLGRNMAYWIEGFSSFYLYCDSLKKKNITNYNYMNPGLRQTNSSVQYFWLGKPNNSYLDRYPLFGPYAYQWKTYPHNRDRNGNGISEGLYSYGWNTNYTLQYDAPAIYGLFMKYGSSNRDKATINAARASVFGPNPTSVTSTRFGFTNGDGGTRGQYGNIWLGNISDPGNATRDYVNSGVFNAETQEMNLYGCSDEDLLAGRCFDPCLSMRYQFGFLPGGKRQDMTTNYPGGSGYRIVANAPVINNAPVTQTQDVNGTFFRGAFGTPHIQYLKTQVGAILTHELNGLSPCFDGGADHCNYITPTLNIGSSMYLESTTSNFFANANLATQSVNL